MQYGVLVSLLCLPVVINYSEWICHLYQIINLATLYHKCTIYQTSEVGSPVKRWEWVVGNLRF